MREQTQIICAMMPATIRPRRGRKRRGTVITEFAVGAGVLMALLAGTFELGYTFIQYNRLQTAVAQGARYAALVPYDSATETPSAAFSSAVKNVVLYGSPDGGTSPIVHGLEASNVDLTVTFDGGVPSLIKVSITGYSIDALFKSHTLTGKPQAMYQYQGVWAPV